VIGAYHAVYFDDIGMAVEFCHSLVPYIAPKAAEALNGDAFPVVWFHVPRRSTSSTRGGCYLLLSTGAIALAQDAGLDAQVCGVIARASRPVEAVLVFGDDRVDRPVLTEPRRRASAPASHALAPAPGSPAPAPHTPTVRSASRVPGLIGTPR
jgi:hypothetical protein